MSSFTSDFKNPPSAFYPVPWWAWNGDMQFDEMRRQLDYMYQQHIQEFFIFALHGLIKPDFLSEEWFEYVAFTLEEAEKRGMKVWIYDDLNWPSGSAGGHVVREHPEKREFVFRFTENRLPAGGSVQVNQENLVLLQAQYGNGPVESADTDEFGYFTNKSVENCRLFAVHLTASARPLTNVMGVHNSWEQRGALDMLDPESFQLWVKYIYEEYEKRFGDKFGNTIKGFFTDEPQTHDYDGPTVPYTAKLIDRFKEKYHYDPIPHLAKLFVDLEDAESFRRDYYALVAEMFSSNFAMLSNWCQERKLLFTGHCIWEEIGENTQSFTLRNGDPHQLLKYFTAPGCDLLGHTIPFLKAEPGIHRCWAHFGCNTSIYTARFVASTARWSGAERTMCEAFGVRNMHSSWAGQKLINDFLAAMGINLINDNTLVYTVSNGTCSKHFYMPAWEHYHCFADCSARLSKFAAFGKVAAEVAVAVPISTVWSKTKVMDWLSGAFKVYADALNNSSELLLRNHIDFEYIFEDAPSSSKELAQFKVIILPKATVIPVEFAERLQQFRQNGGRVIAVSESPVVAGTSTTIECDKIIDGTAGLTAELPPLAWQLGGSGNEDVIAVMRRKENESLLLIANQTCGSKDLTLTNSLDASCMEVLEPESGGVYTLEDKTKWQFRLAEGQSVIVRFADTPTAGAGSISDFIMLENSSESVELEFSGNWQFDFGQLNAAVPALEVRFDPLNKGLEEKWFAAPPEQWYKVCGEFLPFNVRRKECEFYWVRGTFDVSGSIPGNLSLIFANSDAENVYVNGVACDCWSQCPVWDQHNRSCFIAPAVKTGRNEFYVRIRITEHNDEHMKLAGSRDRIPGMILAGNFALAADGVLVEPPSAIAAGSWTKYGFQGLPGWGCYKQEFVLESVPAHPVLEIADAKDTVAVKVNGVELPPRAWRPFRFDLQEVLHEGVNTLEISVSGGMGNLLWRTNYITKAVNVDYGMMGSVVIKNRCK